METKPTKKEPVKRDEFTRKWITENSIDIIKSYEAGVLTVRALHYQLVGRGMTNSIQHYKRVVEATGLARWAGLINFDAFSDHDREVIGFTDWRKTDLDNLVSRGKSQVGAWMNNYSKNRWENQEYAPEIWIEKKALQGVFQTVCSDNDVALVPCKGYPSLTFLNEAKERFESMKYNGKTPIILYFGDYDPSGEDIPRSLQANLSRMGCWVELKRIMLMEHQVIELKLPPAPSKTTDTRNANWDGLGQVELDAVHPDIIRQHVTDAVAEYFDEEKYSELMIQEKSERSEYQDQLRNYVINMGKDLDAEDNE